MKYREPKSCEHDPDKVHDRVLVKVGLCAATEGPYSITCNLDVLDAKRNENDCSAKCNTNKEMRECKPKSVNEEPNEISYKLQSISSNVKFSRLIHYNTNKITCQSI